MNNWCLVEIEEWLDENNVRNYTINKDYSVNVDGNVNLEKLDLEEIPVEFNEVTGLFSCADNKLITLKNCPKKVGKTFYCYNNKLTSLQGCPIEIGEHMDCSSNLLESLEFAPKFVKNNFICGYNPIKNLDNFHTVIGWNFSHAVKNIAPIACLEEFYVDNVNNNRKDLKISYKQLQSILMFQKMDESIKDKNDSKNKSYNTIQKAKI